jgi:hypothetical protein
MASSSIFPGLASLYCCHALLIIGSTGSGKSEGELVDLVRIADQRKYAVILLEGHGPLAFRAAGHWIAAATKTG